MSKKIGDLTVKVGEYQKDGQTKGKYENVGALMEGDDGRQFMLLKRTFNPAGVPGTGDKDSVLISIFENNGQGQGGGQQRQQSGGYGGGNGYGSGGYQNQNHRQQGPPAPDTGFDDDIPF